MINNCMYICSVHWYLFSVNKLLYYSIYNLDLYQYPFFFYVFFDLLHLQFVTSILPHHHHLIKSNNLKNKSLSSDGKNNMSLHIV